MTRAAFGLSMNRRELFALSGGSLAAALAGCLGGDDSTEETPDDAPTEQEPTPTPADPTPTPTETDGEDPTETPQENGDAQTPSEIPGDPAQTLDEYVTAIAQGDEEAALALVHEEGNQDEDDVSSDISYFEDRNIRIVDRTVIEAEEDEVTVRGVLETQVEGADKPNRIGLQMRMRRGENDEWLIYEGRGFQIDESGNSDE